MTLPEGLKSVPSFSTQGILMLSTPTKDHTTAEEALDAGAAPYIINDGSHETIIRASGSSGVSGAEIRQANSVLAKHESLRAKSEPSSSAEQVQEGSLPSNTSSRRNVSWYEASLTASTSTSSTPKARRDLTHQEGESGSATEAPLRHQRKPSDSSRDGEMLTRQQQNYYVLSDRSASRLLLSIYAAIFCISWTTSLDLSTSYLYLNFACSEYGSLSSFSTVSIVQQMIYALGKPVLAKLSDVLGRFSALTISLAFYSSGYLLASLSLSLRSLLIGMILQSVGSTGIQTQICIIIADTASARWRGLVLAVVNLPYLINFAFSGMLVDAVMKSGSDGILKHWNGWRLGFGIWSVIVPISALPLLYILHLGQKKARELGLTCKEYGNAEGVGHSSQSWNLTIKRWAKELDVLGLVLLSFGGSLVLLPLTLAGRRESIDAREFTVAPKTT